MKTKQLILVILIIFDFYSKIFSQELLIYKNNSNLYGFVKANTNDVVISPKYDYAYGFRKSGLALVKKDLKWGFINKTGKEVIPIKYDYADGFSEGLAIVLTGKLFGYIDTTGKEVIPLKYDAGYRFSGGLAAVQKGKLHAYINKAGKEITPYKYFWAKTFGENADGVTVEDMKGMALVAIDDPNTGYKWKWGMINTKGEEIIPLKYFTQFTFYEGFAVVLLDLDPPNATCTYIDNKGKELTSATYNNCNGFKDGIAKVTKIINNKAKVGYIDITGKEVIPAMYDVIDEPISGLIRVGQRIGKWESKTVYGYFDKSGKIIVPIEYDELYYDEWDGGIISAYKGSKKINFDKQGNIKKNYKPTAR